MNPSKPYHDHWLRLIGSLFFSHLIETLGREKSLAEQWLDEDYWIALGSGWFICFLIWYIISRISIQLDRHWDWMTKPVQRICFQVAFGVIAPAVIVLLLAGLAVNIFWDQNIIHNGFQAMEFPVVLLILIMINSTYFTWYLFNRLKRDEPVPANQLPVQNKFLNVLMVSSGKMQLPVPVAEIQYITRQGDYTRIKTMNREFVESTSLDDLEQSLDPTQFFRANRQVIIAFTSCKGIKSLEYGKLEVQTDPPLDEPLVVSQKKSRAFREWMAAR